MILVVNDKIKFPNLQYSVQVTSIQEACLQHFEMSGATGEDKTLTPPLMINGKPHLPFQLQTEYTTADGSVLVRVITKVKPVTEDRKIAERGTVHTNVLLVCPNILVFYQVLTWMLWGSMLYGHQLAWQQRESFLRQGQVQ